MDELPHLQIDPDITRASTLPASVYHEPRWFRHQQDRLFARTWHMHPQPTGPQQPSEQVPWNLLPGCLDEPLLLTRDDHDRLHCISNVCTHRGKVLVEQPCRAGGIRCGYHGRRFGLDGRFVSMPAFEGARNFPSTSDDLARVPFRQWHNFLFASLAPIHSFDDLMDPVVARTRFLPLDRMEFLADHSPQYYIRGNWALYCDNYLEGFHIPFVHPSLNDALDFDAYRTELWDWGSLQVGSAGDHEVVFDFPKSHPDHGQRIAGYYFWLFPTTMINVYPWGLSLNVVVPKGPTQTTIVYQTWAWDRPLHNTGAGAGLDQVEYEDDAVVESTAAGIRSRLYKRGRYSPSQERGVHHFHRLMARLLNDA